MKDSFMWLQWIMIKSGSSEPLLSRSQVGAEPAVPLIWKKKYRVAQDFVLWFFSRRQNPDDDDKKMFDCA